MTEDRDPALDPETDVEAGPEAEAEAPAAPEVGGAMEGDVEEADGQEAESQDEELDDRGVPLKNKVAELERKLRERDEKMERLLEKALERDNRKDKPSEEEQAPSIFDQRVEDVTDQELIAAGFTEDHVKLLNRRAAAIAQKQMEAAVKKADRERVQLQKMREEAWKARTNAIKAAAKEFGDEFGSLVTEREGGGWDWDRNSPLYKRASEIYLQDRNLQSDPHGEAVAARKAYLELYREKYGRKAPAKSNNLAASQRMLGKGGTAKGRGAIKDSNGKFHRELTPAEFDGLRPDEQTEYLIQSGVNRWGMG